MEPLSPHRTFLDPGNVRGIPGVTKRTPIQPRETPLPGTKAMLCPRDEHLPEIITPRVAYQAPPSRAAVVLGILAMICTMALLAFCWLASRDTESNSTDGLILPMLIAVHLFAIFSQVLSSGRNLIGALAIPVLYSGLILSMVVGHFLR